MAKTGRNDPCPCGSGEKYKHCFLNFPSTKLKSFQRLAESPRRKIILSDIATCDNVLLRNSPASLLIKDRGDNAVIYYNVEKPNETLIAHEIGHIVLYRKGYKHLQTRSDASDEQKYFALTINMLVDDILVEELLIEHGFDPIPMRKSELLADIRKLKNQKKLKAIPESPRNNFLITVYHFIQAVLFRNAGILSKERVDEFIGLGEAYLPKEMEFSMNLIRLISKYNFDEPDSHNELLDKLVAFFNEKKECFRLNSPEF